MVAVAAACSPEGPAVRGADVGHGPCLSANRIAHSVKESFVERRLAQPPVQTSVNLVAAPLSRGCLGKSKIYFSLEPNAIELNGWLHTAVEIAAGKETGQRDLPPAMLTQPDWTPWRASDHLF